MNKTVHFSIIIPLYNKKQYIERTLQSVLSQTYRFFEVIVVNDGSIDGGDLLVKQKFSSTVRLINQDHQGVSVARNTGALNSNYNYICLLDADDEWRPNFLEEISILLNLYPERNIYSLRHEIVTDKGKLITLETPFKENFRGVVSDFLTLYRRSSCIINASSVCLKKSYFHRLGGFPVGQTQGEDVYLWLLYAVHTELVYSNVIGSRYNKNTHNGSATRVENEHLPFQFSYFYQWIKHPINKVQTKAHKSELLKFLRKDALLHIADLILRNRRVAVAHSSLMFSHNKTTGTLCFCLFLVPSILLEHIREVRNQRRNNV